MGFNFNRYTEIKILCFTLEQFMMDTGLTKEEILEDYGEGVEKLFFAEGEELNPGCLAGVQYKDGNCSVFGLNRDEEGITFGRMLEVLLSEFIE